MAHGSTMVLLYNILPHFAFLLQEPETTFSNCPIVDSPK